MMSFKTFIVEAQKNDFWGKTHSFCFRGQSYPSLFFTTLFSHLNVEKTCSMSYKKLSLEDIDQKTVYGMLSQSMLGMQLGYWFGDITQSVSEKKCKEYVDYFIGYQGPHTIVFFVEGNEKIAPSDTCTVIAIDYVIDYTTALKIFAFFACTLDERRIQIVRSIFQHNETLSLDSVCLLMHYLELMPTKLSEQAVAYIMKILGTAPSLSMLTESFFAKDAQRFFSLWSVLEKDFPDIFWIIFWSEHVWRAYNVMQFLQEKNFVQAKRMSFRLPYSFINRDWQKNSLSELVHAYQNLYSIDFTFKKGSSCTALDLFYVNYFNGKFASV